MRWLMSACAVIAVATVDEAAVAQTTQVAKPTLASEQNKVICRTQEMTGSRLTQSRKCLTRAQWAQLNREERMTIEKVQRLYFDCKLSPLEC